MAVALNGLCARANDNLCHDVEAALAPFFHVHKFRHQPYVETPPPAGQARWASWELALVLTQPHTVAAP